MIKIILDFALFAKKLNTVFWIGALVFIFDW